MSLAHVNPRGNPANTMVFIDGGYLERFIIEELGETMDHVHLGKLGWEIIKKAFDGETELARIVRAYYYNGIVNPTESEYTKQKEFHDKIDVVYANFEVREGRLIKDGEGKFRQKGVDTLLAIDMIEKANSNQYEIAIVIAGDLDHLEAVKTVKNKGIQICGIFRRGHIAEDLMKCFDRRFELNEIEPEKFIKND